MKHTKSGLLLLLSLLILSGCAHVISKDLRKTADLSLGLAQVIQNPAAYKGKTVVWGGEIILTENQQGGTTLIEIFQRPLDTWGEPKGTLASEGRFLALVEKPLDPYLFRTGKRITVGGEIQGEETRPLGKGNYRYPLLLAREVHLWEYYYYPYYYYPYYYYPYYYNPWWWGPYPYGWRFDFYRHYHHHR
jgi:outer membrane lipoprotein